LHSKLRVLDKAEYSAFQSTLNSPIVSYRIEVENTDNVIALGNKKATLMSIDRPSDHETLYKTINC